MVIFPIKIFSHNASSETLRLKNFYLRLKFYPAPLGKFLRNTLKFLTYSVSQKFGHKFKILEYLCNWVILMGLVDIFQMSYQSAPCFFGEFHR
jgi:hypothetical protein